MIEYKVLGKTAMTIIVSVNREQYPELDAAKIVGHISKIENFHAKIATMLDYYIGTTPERIN
jgi:hypothetical protein